MNKNIKALVDTCEKCQLHGRSTEISHKSMFNLYPNHTIHADYCVYGGQVYILLVDRVTGYIMAEQTVNQGTDAAISVVRNWGLLFGNPMRVISDDGGAFRNDFIEKLRRLNIRDKHSSAYHPESNSLAERAVGSLKNTLRKSPKVISTVALKEISFQINSNISQNMTGSANDRFLMRSVRSNMPNSINNQINPQELINKRIEKHEGRMKNKNKNKVSYPVGTLVRIQDSKTKLFDTNGTIVEHRWTDSQEVVSYIIRTDKELLTTRHCKYLKQLDPLNSHT